MLALSEESGPGAVGEAVLGALADAVRGAALADTGRGAARDSAARGAARDPAAGGAAHHPADRAAGPDSARWSVLTRENVEALLPPGTALADCLHDCEIEVGRRLGAEVVLTGALTRLGPTRTRVTLRAHATADATLLAQAGADAPSTAQLPEATRAAARQLLAALAAAGAAESIPAAGPHPTHVTLRGGGGATLQRLDGGRAHPLCRAPCDLAIDPQALHWVAFDAPGAATRAFSLPAGEAWRVTARPRAPARQAGGFVALALGGLALSAGMVNGVLDEGLPTGYTVGGVAGGLGLLVLGGWLVATAQTELRLEPLEAAEIAPFPPAGDPRAPAATGGLGPPARETQP